MEKSNLEQKSKYLAYILRHRPDVAGIVLDKEGWTDLTTLIKNTDLSAEEVELIVQNDAKQRYSISADGTKIRANQGHSTKEVSMTFEKAVPPVVLYHGTTSQAIDQILKQGLKPMNRHHVHLTNDVAIALSVGGRRHGETVLLEVDAKAMLADNHTFYLSTNGVWLVKSVPPKYLRKK